VGTPIAGPSFIAAFEALANVATKMTTAGAGRPFKVHAPLIHLGKAQIIRRGLELGVDYGLTLSCYDPDAQGRACGRCDSVSFAKRASRRRGWRILRDIRHHFEENQFAA